MVEKAKGLRAPIIRDDEVFVRMSRTERWQHGWLIVSFLALIATGLPRLVMGGMIMAEPSSGIGVRATLGLIHRVAAVLLMADLCWHVLYTALSRRGRRNLLDRRPRRKDLEDALIVLGRNTGATSWLRRRGLIKGDASPDFGRYSFVQKFEYWSFLSGSAVMIVTGLLMWRSDLSLRFLPLWAHRAVVALHGYEALLAFVAVILWHMYTAHLRPEVFPMSKVWLDGRITGAELRRLHPTEYRRIEEERRSAKGTQGRGD